MVLLAGEILTYKHTQFFTSFPFPYLQDHTETPPHPPKEPASVVKLNHDLRCEASRQDRRRLDGSRPSHSGTAGGRSGSPGDETRRSSGPEKERPLR